MLSKKSSARQAREGFLRIWATAHHLRTRAPLSKASSGEAGRRRDDNLSHLPTKQIFGHRTSGMSHASCGSRGEARGWRAGGLAVRGYGQGTAALPAHSCWKGRRSNHRWSWRSRQSSGRAGGDVHFCMRACLRFTRPAMVDGGRGINGSLAGRACAPASSVQHCTSFAGLSL